MARLPSTLLAPVAALALGGCVSVHQHRALQRSYDELQGREEALDRENRQLRLLAEALHAALQDARAEDLEDQAGLAAFYEDLLAAFQPQLDAEQVAVMVYPDRVTLALADGVHFESGSAALTPEGCAAIDTLAEVLARHPDRRFVVEGHTDDVPISTARFPNNRALGAGRAVAVTDALTAAGVAEERLSAASFGESAPLAENGSARGRARNRRVEIAFQPTLDELPGYERIVEAAKRVVYAEGAPKPPPSDAVSAR